MKTATMVRTRTTSLFILALVLGVTACDMAPAFGSGSDDNMCLMGGCGGGGGSYEWSWTSADSIVIPQRDTSITFGDSLLVRVNVYPDTTTLHLLNPEPYGAAQVTWLRKEGTNTDVWKVRPLVEGAIALVATDYGKADTLRLQVRPRG